MSLRALYTTIGTAVMSIVKTYRKRAVGFIQLAARTGEPSLKDKLNELARACTDVADAIERNAELVEFYELERPTLLH